MAMGGNKLGQEIANAIMNTDAPPDVKVQVLALWEKIGTAIVDHIKDNAIVPFGIAVSTPVGPGATSAPGSVE
jgi:predicted KAP-like P-loop ATPase